MYRRYARVEVDLSAISHNVRTLKAMTPPGTLFEAVVKADGYGHGAIESARAALSAGADRLGVATIEEGLELRAAELTAPIHILSEPPASSVGLIVEHSLIPSVATREFATELGKAAASYGREALYHLKVDTGMNRLGVRAEEAAEFSAGLKDFPGLKLEGTFTHFATAETPGDWDFERQLARFSEAVEQMRTEGVDAGIVHSANSAATILHPESHLSMVRCGISIYGLHPGHATRDKADLRPAMSVKAQVSFVKRINMGEGVSYGLTWQATAPTTIATIPLGYADGLHRVLSNEMSVLVNGTVCRQVGRVTMDQIMIEVPRGMDLRIGDEAVIVGTQGEKSIEMDELAELAGTINYEIACSFGTMRLERIHI